MALMTEVQNSLRQKAIQEERIRKGMIEKFGEPLGLALANYMKDSAEDKEREMFASAVVKVFESIDHESRVLAISALLLGIEKKIDSAKEEAGRPVIY
jgi:hypothetical protein